MLLNRTFYRSLMPAQGKTAHSRRICFHVSVGAHSLSNYLCCVSKVSLNFRKRARVICVYVYGKQLYLSSRRSLPDEGAMASHRSPLLRVAASSPTPFLRSNPCSRNLSSIGGQDAKGPPAADEAPSSALAAPAHRPVHTSYIQCFKMLLPPCTVRRLLMR